MNKTNIIAVLLLFAVAGVAMADVTEYDSSVILDVNISSACGECFVAGVPIAVTVEVGDLNGTCNMSNITITANFTGDDVNEQITHFECDIDNNGTTMNCTGNVTINVTGVDVTCEVVATNLTGECANETIDFQMMDTIVPIVIDGYCHKHNMMIGNHMCSVYDLSATCYGVCGDVVNCGNVIWSCTNPDVATINATTGELVADDVGIATVDATCDDGSASVNITVCATPSFWNMAGFGITGENVLISGDTKLIVDLGEAKGSMYVQEIGDPVGYEDADAIDGIVVKGAHVYAQARDNSNPCNYTYTLAMWYDAGDVVGLGIDVNTLTILKWNVSNWNAVDDTVNEGGCVIADIDGNGTYALVGTPPVKQRSSGGGRDGTYPPEQFDDDSDDSDSDSDDTDDAVVIDDAVVVPDPVDIPDVVETPTTENTLDADIEHPDDDDGVNILWLFAGAVAVIAIGCAAVIKRRT